LIVRNIDGSYHNTHMRRAGIVPLARKLLIALWRLVLQGVVPEGVVLRSA
jgi:hypothetical protein